MASNSIRLLSSKAELIDDIGDPVRVPSVSGLYSVQITTTAFVGRIRLEASLMSDPGPDDWFGIAFDNGTLDLPETGTKGSTNTFIETFRGNFLVMRASMIRSHLIAPGTRPEKVALYGAVDRVLLNYFKQ